MRNRNIGLWEKRLYGSIILLFSMTLAVICAFVAGRDFQAGELELGAVFSAAGLLAVLLVTFSFRLLASAGKENYELSPVVLRALSCFSLIGTVIGAVIAAKNGMFLAVLPSAVIIILIASGAFVLASKRARNAA